MYEPESFPSDAWALLSPRLTEARREKMIRIARQRTHTIRLVVQDVNDPHNIAACMRSAEAFGVQKVDVVNIKKSLRRSTVARGVHDWLTIRKHPSVKDTVETLHAEGYLIAAGVPRPDAKSLYELPLDRKLAVVFGNEREGIDSEWLEHIDTPFTIPMYGFVESMNISVCAAITLSHLTHAAREALTPEQFHLTPAEHEEVLNAWICKQIPSWKGELEHARAQGK